MSVLQMSQGNQRTKCSEDRSLNTQPSKTSLIKPFMMGHQNGMSSNMLRSVGIQVASIQQDATRIRSLN